MQQSLQSRLIQFLQTDLSIPEDVLSFAVRRQDSVPNQLPIVLWHYGLITLEQLDQIFDWLELA